MDLNLILSWIGLIFSLLGIIYGTLVAGRVEGKLKSAVIFLILAVIAFMIKEILMVSGLFVIEAVEFIRQGVNIAIILFIFLAVFKMKQAISVIDNHYKKKYKPS